MNFGAQVLTNQISVALRHQNGIFFGTDGINTKSETPVSTENRVLPSFLSQFKVLSSLMYPVGARHFAACVLPYSYTHLHYFSCHLLCHGLRKKIKKKTLRWMVPVFRFFEYVKFERKEQKVNPAS